MSWYVCLILSVACLGAAVICSVTGNRRDKAFNIIFAGVFTAVFCGLIPVFITMVEGESFAVIKLIAFDILQTLQVFTVNVGGDLILDNINSSMTEISGIYSVWMTVLFVAAPIMTFGFIITLFRDALSGIRYRFSLKKETFIFSELNPSSLALAKDLKNNHNNSLIVFTNVNEDTDAGERYDAGMLGAICFNKEITSLPDRRGEVSCFLIGENESENLISAVRLTESHGKSGQKRLYVFSTHTEGELLVSNIGNENLVIHRVNISRSLVYDFLYMKGTRIFETAKSADNGVKKITAVVLGMGTYGIEMVKALSWYCQMDGYEIEIHAFDRDPDAEDKFTALCPELMDKSLNGAETPLGESKYRICIHAGVEAGTAALEDILNSIGDITFGFVCLGDDGEDINAAVELRILCERNDDKPLIESVVYNTEENRVLDGVKNYRKQSYNIDFIGGEEELFSEKVILDSELEKEALDRHLKWGDEKEFWKYEYNYRSSMASAIHIKARKLLGIPGADKEVSERTLEERESLKRLEHRRWNAYMRSEGYVYSGSTDKSSRNDLAKMHHNLVEYDLLSDEDKAKDSV